MPGDGSQQVSLTHVDDVAALMVCAIGNNRAKGETFNCGTDNMIT
jgi:nucleoside-diphosphate-sugar epimerase